MANWNHFRLRDFGLQSGYPGYEGLYRLLTDQAATPKPDRGALVRLPPRPVPEVGIKTPGAPTTPTRITNETAAGGTRQASLGSNSTKTHTDHLGYFRLQVPVPARTAVTYVATHANFRTQEDYAAAGTIGLRFKLERKEP